MIAQRDQNSQFFSPPKARSMRTKKKPTKRLTTGIGWVIDFQPLIRKGGSA
jgi:hypothetical protein